MSKRTYEVGGQVRRLLALLPRMYSGRDESGELASFLALFAQELQRLRRNIDQLHADQFIDSCQDWVVPYIGALVDTNIVENDAARNRIDVRDTVKWRRCKGTRVCLEDVAAAIYASGAHAVEMFEHLVWNQNLGRPRITSLATAPLTDPVWAARLGTPSADDARTIDLRPAFQRIGRHRVRALSVFLWSLNAYPWENAAPFAETTRRWRFHPLGLDLPLFARAPGTGCTNRPHADICGQHADNISIRNWDFAATPLAYFGQAGGFSVYEDGILLCRADDRQAAPSVIVADGYTELAADDGIILADRSDFGPAQSFWIEAVRVGLKNGESGETGASMSTRNFADVYRVAEPQGRLVTNTAVYRKGTAYQPDSPDFHLPPVLLRITRKGSAATFPESEVILRSGAAKHLLVYLPKLTSLAVNEPLYLYVAADGGSYFARGSHDAGEVDRNPDSGTFGAFLARHRARGSAGQFRASSPGTRVAVQRNLARWEDGLRQPLSADQVAFDPSLGRFLFPVGEEPTGRLTVDFHFGRTGPVGAGPEGDGTRATATRTVAQLADADHRSIQDAIDAAAGTGRAEVIEIIDGLTYAESLIVAGNHAPGLTIQTRDGVAPTVVAGGGDVLRVRATATARELALTGLVLAGGDVRIDGAVTNLRLDRCTLDPRSVACRIQVPTTGARVTIHRTILGPLDSTTTGATTEVEDCILQHPDASPAAPDGGVAVSVAGQLRIRRTTVLGEGRVGEIQAANCIFCGTLRVTDCTTGCVRYSRIAASDDDLPTYRCTDTTPLFRSWRHEHPEYAHLHPGGAPELAGQGEDGGEMGAFHGAGLPWRKRNVALKLAEYAPAAIEVALVSELPRLWPTG